MSDAEQKAADALRHALNEFERDGGKFQRFSAGSEDTATAMVRYALRALAYPTPAMIEAGHNVYWTEFHQKQADPKDALAAAFAAMLRAETREEQP